MNGSDIGMVVFWFWFWLAIAAALSWSFSMEERPWWYWPVLFGWPIVVSVGIVIGPIAVLWFSIKEGGQ